MLNKLGFLFGGGGIKTPIFIVVIIGIVGFIIYSTWKKKKNEGTHRKKREDEVREMIKHHLRDKENIKNVNIKYVEVVPRNESNYRDRDVFDVFIEIRKVRNGKNEVIGRRAYEIEGRVDATAPTPESKDAPVPVKWAINREFKYEEHAIHVHEKPSWKLSIYFKSIFRKNRKEYIEKELKKNEEIRMRNKLEKEKQKRDAENENEKVFKPTIEPKKKKGE